MKKTCLLVYPNLCETKWCKDILEGKGIATGICQTMSRLHEKMTRHYDFVIVVGKNLPHGENSERFSSTGDVISLLKTNRINFLILEDETPNSRKVIEFLQKQEKTQSIEPCWPEIEPTNYELKATGTN